VDYCCIYSDDSHRPWVPVSWRLYRTVPGGHGLNLGKQSRFMRCLADSGGDPFSRLKSGPRGTEPNYSQSDRGPAWATGPRWAMGMVQGSAPVR
jgi:hypothetical protein